MPTGIVLDSAGLSTSFEWSPPAIVGDTLYPLGPLPTEFDALRWPDAPVIASEVVVSNATQLTAALNTNGVRIIVRPGTYSGRYTFGGTDKEIVFQPGAEIVNSSGTTLSVTGRRITVRGGMIRGGMYLYNNLTDVLFDGVEIITARNSPNNDTITFFGALQRVAIINSRFSSQHYSPFVSGGSDYIFAGNDFHADGPESTIRLAQDVTRTVVIDNRIYNGQKHTFRAHDRSDLIYLARNRFENTGIMIDGPNGQDVGRVWLIDNTAYHQSNSLWQFGAGVIWVEATGNTAYTVLCSNPAGCAEVLSQRPGWGTVSNNQRFPYQSPPPVG